MSKVGNGWAGVRRGYSAFLPPNLLRRTLAIQTKVVVCRNVAVVTKNAIVGWWVCADPSQRIAFPGRAAGPAWCADDILTPREERKIEFHVGRLVGG